MRKTDAHSNRQTRRHDPREDKLYAGYPGDSQWGALPSDELLVTQQAAVMRSSSLGGGGGGVIVGSDDSCDDVTGVGCPCWHGYCLFDVQHDRAEHHEISAANPAIVQRLLKRLMEVRNQSQPVVLTHTAGNTLPLL